MGKVILDKTGISQRALAAFAGADHSHLSRYEAATRSLPSDAMLELAKMLQLLNTLPPPPAATPVREAIDGMQKKAAWCQTTCTILQRQLKNMETAYLQAATMLQFVTAYVAANPELTIKKQRWIDEQRYQANKKLVKNGWLPQQALRIKIALLQYEASLYTNL